MLKFKLIFKSMENSGKWIFIRSLDSGTAKFLFVFLFGSEHTKNYTFWKWIMNIALEKNLFYCKIILTFIIYLAFYPNFPSFLKKRTCIVSSCSIQKVCNDWYVFHKDNSVRWILTCYDLTLIDHLSKGSEFKIKKANT